jgi:hypothetical protein
MNRSPKKVMKAEYFVFLCTVIAQPVKVPDCECSGNGSWQEFSLSCSEQFCWEPNKYQMDQGLVPYGWKWSLHEGHWCPSYTVVKMYGSFASVPPMCFHSMPSIQISFLILKILCIILAITENLDWIFLGVTHEVLSAHMCILCIYACQS